MSRTAKTNINVKNNGLSLGSFFDILNFAPGASASAGIGTQAEITASGGSTKSFEYYAQNQGAYNITATSSSSTQVVKTFALGGGLFLTSTLTLSGGVPTTKVLSGNLPSDLNGITTCTYDFSGGHTIPLKTYS